MKFYRRSKNFGFLQADADAAMAGVLVRSSKQKDQLLTRLKTYRHFRPRPLQGLILYSLVRSDSK